MIDLQDDHLLAKSRHVGTEIKQSGRKEIAGTKRYDEEFKGNHGTNL